VSEFAKIEENFSHNLEGRGPWRSPPEL
jgi:hypothetical protein